MRAWDSVTESGSLRLGPAALTILLVGLLLSLAPVSERLEMAYYDALAGLRRAKASDEVILVDSRDLVAGGGSAWESAQLPQLLAALRQSGARLVIPTQPPPLTAGLPGAAQLAALAQIERQSRGSLGSGGADSFARQLSAMREKSDLQARTVDVIGTMRNLVLAVPTSEGNRASYADQGACRKHVLDIAPDAVGEDAPALRRVRAVSAPAERLCHAILGAGHVDFWADDDGVVRRAELLVDAGGQTVPAAALRAVLALSYPGSQSLAIEAHALAWDARRTRTTAGATALIGFYRGIGGEPAFRTLGVSEILGQANGARGIEGRIVVLGPARTGEQDAGYRSPVDATTSTALLTATVLSNLLQGDFVGRPGWLPWAETTLLIGLGLAALWRGTRLSIGLTALAGSLVAVSLLGLEAYLLLATNTWMQGAANAAFVLLALAALRIVHAGRPRLAASGPAMAVAGASSGAPTHVEDEMDLSFSMLRHQPASESVKQRLYDLAVEHARRRDLAKAERVLRHLASIDPHYRNAGEKLRKLAGMRRGQESPSAGVGEPRPPVLMPVRPADDLSGKTIGRYQIEQAIGRGAMATVYLGRDPKINRKVAIKTIALAQEFSDSDLANARTQFLREAESAGRLNHPNIISIYDAGEDGDVAYLAMEYFPGKPLSHFTQPGEFLPADKIFDLMARAADALHYAHAQHVVHRDVKPANLMYDPDTDALKITDFGIARLTDSSRTKTGIILGTPSYMSPEQLAGTTVTGQSDLFSLGITLYQLLAGVPPFRADSIPKLMQKIAHERHPPLASVRDDLPACVDQLLDRALAKDPAGRFENGRAMALALRDCCSSLGLSTAVGAP